MENDCKKTFDSLAEDLQMKLVHIKEFLWSGQAAVMVGAGFSKNAESMDGNSMADWNTLAYAIYDRLHPMVKSSRALDFVTPTRLASEYAAAFSRSDLDTLIDQVLPDGNMKPSALHEKLLNLPWEDVFTTNYDTLLERSLSNVDCTYGLVTNKSTLIYSKSPRIIKLHGSMPDIHPYIMTEEDYRTYPNKYPELVNTVRQALIEKMFCLIGFSADDPNFLSWIGWLKDVMGREHSSVYLITFDKEMKYTHQYLLADRNIKILNLAETKPGVKGFETYSEALDFFFTYMGGKDESKLEGWDCEVKIDWRKKENVDEAIQAMRERRLRYPGWIIMPASYFRKFKDLEDYIPFGKGLPEGLTLEQRIKLMYELDFRLNVTLSPKVIDWYKKELENLITIDRDSAGENYILVTALLVSLLSIYREEENVKDFENLEETLSKNVKYMNEETKNRFHYERCLMNLYKLDYGRVRSILRKWHVEASNHKAMLWRACITAEVNRPQEAEYQLYMCRDYIRSALGHNSSKSRVLTESNKIVAWMSTVYACSYMWSDELSRQSRQNRDNLFRELLRMFSEELKKEQRPQVEYISGFNIGDRSTRWNCPGGAYINDFFYSYKTIKLFEEIGHPFGFPRMSVEKGALTVAFSHLYKYKPTYVVNNIARTFDKSHVEGVMDKDAIRMLDTKAVKNWAEVRLNTVEEWINADDKALKEKIKFSILHIAARLCALLDEESIIRVCNVVLKVDEGRFQSDRIKLLNLICNYLDNKILEQSVVPSMLACEIQDTWDLDFPAEDIDLGNLPQSSIDIIINGLQSNDENIQRKAYERAEYLHRHHLNLNDLSPALIAWRNNGNPLETYKLHSYSIVDYDKEKDKVSPKDLLSQVLEKLKNNCQAKTNGGSSPIHLVTNDLQCVSVLLKFADADQKNLSLTCVGNFLNSNKDILLRDDSKEFMGGLRHFTNELLHVFSEIVRRIYTNKGDLSSLDKDEMGKVCDILEEYYAAGHKIGTLLLRLCLIAERQFNHKANMENGLVSYDKEERNDACNMFLFFAREGEDVSTVLDKLLAYTEICQDERMETYLRILCILVAEGLMDDNHMGKTAALIDCMKTNIPTFGCSGNSKSSIIYQAAMLAGALHGRDKDGKYVSSTSPWTKMREDGWGLNDEQKGFSYGLQFAQRMINK